MPNRSFALIALALVLLAHPAQGANSVRINSPVAEPGESFALEAVFEGEGGPEVAGVQVDLTLPAGVRIESFGGKPDCTADPAAGKEDTGFALRPADCQGIACTGVRALVLSLTSVDPIPPGTRMFACRGTVSQSASPSSQAIGCESLMSSPQGEELPSTCLAAQLTIASPAQPRLAIGSVSATAGEEVTLDVGLETRGATVASAQADLVFPAGTSVAALPDGSPDCELAPEVDKAGLFAFQPFACMPGIDCRAVRLLAVDVSAPVTALTDTTRLFRCRLQLAEDLGPGRHALDCVNDEIGDPQGNVLASSCTSGQIRVPDSDLPDLAIGNASAPPGQTFPIDVTLAAKQQQIAAVQVDIAFPSGIMAIASSGKPSCVVNPAVGAHLSGFSFQPGGCIPGSTCKAVRGLLLSTQSLPLPDGPLFTCQARADEDLPPADYRLACTREGANDPEALERSVNCIDGLLSIGMPTPTPSPTATSAPQGCFGDCNGSGTLTASDIGRINSTILRCSPCAGGVPGGVASGCGGLPSGCMAADFNGDGCIRASELGRANQNILRFPSGCSAPPTPTPILATCGDETLSGDEECDDGNNHGGDGCAANCTFESDITLDFGSSGTTQSESVLQTSFFALVLNITGKQVITRGQPRAQASLGADGFTHFNPGEMPIATSIDKNREDGVGFIEPITVPGLVCACIRGIELRSCGGRPVLPGNTDPNNGIICNDDPSACDASPDGPCGSAFGPGVSAAGRVGCVDGLQGGDYDFISYKVAADSLTGDVTLTPAGDASTPGAMYNLSFTAIGTIQDSGTCSIDPSDPRKGPDGIPCTDDDPSQSRGTPSVSLQTTGTATANVLNVNNQTGKNIEAGVSCGAAPCIVSSQGTAVSCENLFAGNTGGLCLASAVATLDQPTTGDIAAPTRYCALAP